MFSNLKERIRVHQKYSVIFPTRSFKKLPFLMCMNTRITSLLLGLPLLGCGSEEQPTADFEVQRLEKKIDLLLQQQDSEERIFLRNIRLLQGYISDRPAYYHSLPQDTSFSLDERASSHFPAYGNFKSWSKHTLDGFASLFIDAPGGKSWEH